MLSLTEQCSIVVDRTCRRAFLVALALAVLLERMKSTRAMTLWDCKWRKLLQSLYASTHRNKVCVFGKLIKIFCVFVFAIFSNMTQVSVKLSRWFRRFCWWSKWRQNTNINQQCRLVPRTQWLRKRFVCYRQTCNRNKCLNDNLAQQCLIFGRYYLFIRKHITVTICTFSVLEKCVFITHKIPCAYVT